MLTRETTLAHPNGDLVDLPLLVPSFTSKGFPFFTEPQGKKRRTFSETSNALESLGPYLGEAMLVSAYDLHHQHFRQPEKFFKIPSLLFLDSGGYELASDFDSSEPKLSPTLNKGFSQDDHLRLLQRLYKRFAALPFTIANYDWGTNHQPFEKQIHEASKLFARFPGWRGNCILKPHRANSTVINMDALTAHIEALRCFHVIGVAEKELGKNLLDRLKRIARLRTELTKRGVTAPIHIYGGLDPVITPLYFFAGADIFDGVSWLRYSYYKGLAVNRQCYAVMAKNLITSGDHAAGLSMNENLMVLQRLATNLRSFYDSGGTRFEVFEDNQDVFENAYRTMTTKIDELKGGA